MAGKTKKIANHISEMQWTVRDENGGVFGPVDFDTLMEWVEDGRLSPFSEISVDAGDSWVQAVNMAELEMNCVAQIESGSFYGPIHHKAMYDLVDSGSIPSDAVLFSRDDTVNRKIESQRQELADAAEQIAELKERNTELRNISDRLNSDLQSRIENLKEKEKAFSLRISKMTLDHEKAVNAVRQESLRIQHSLQEKNRSLQEKTDALQDENRSLQELNRLVSKEKDKLSGKIRQLARDNKKAHDDSEAELQIRQVRIEELCAVKKELLKEIDALRASNGKQKAEFIAFEKERASADCDRNDRRRLLVLKQLFADAAALLRDVDDDTDVETDEKSDSRNHNGQGALLEYEEVDTCGRPVADPVPVHNDKKTDIVTESEQSNTVQSASVIRKNRKKTSKKWLFGKGEKNIDHRALAELEAQARSELQRLSFGGGDISALFDNNK
ncbi:MAG: hypothetical protein R6V06_00180 [Kiritimatiellia bacterium]